MSKTNGVAIKEKAAKDKEQKRTYLSQTDVPNYSLDDALVIPRAIYENYAGKPATPLQVARALNVLPSSGPFRMLCGASIAYGLTRGGYNATEIILEPLAIRIFKPKVEGDDLAAKTEAFLKPRVMSEFLSKYDGASIPREDIAKNILEEIGVPTERLDSVYEFILTQGEKLGIIVDLKSKKYVELNKTRAEIFKPNGSDTLINEVKDSRNNDEFVNDTLKKLNLDNNSTPEQPQQEKENHERLKRVFITHGRNTKFIDPIKKLLSFGELLPVVSVERTTISQPVPDKVMNDMRSCGAAIIHVEDELKLIDDKANEHVFINQNVLIEIGAAMALFGRRFILLVKDGIKLPSNLQGLFEVRYTGDELDGSATIKLLEAINDIKNQNLPK
jgi:predicted nucleotide-binding protein